MVEKSDKKKPKATLIKHRKAEVLKPPIQENLTDTEKKKVLVVKKKKVVVKSKITSASRTGGVGLNRIEKAEFSDTQKITVREGELDKKAPPIVEQDSQKSRLSVSGATRNSGRSAASNDTGITGDRKLDRTADKTEQTRVAIEKSPRNASYGAEAAGISSEKIGSGKDTVASPPRGMKNINGIQTYESKRIGGRAGIVSGRRVDGDYSRRPAVRTENRQRNGSFNRVGYNRGSAGGTGRAGNYVPGKSFRQSENRTPGGRRGTGTPVRTGTRIGSGGTGRSIGGVGAYRNSPASSPPPNRGKSFYKAKKIYDKHREEQEKIYQYSKKKQITQSNPVPKEIDMMEVITVSELARKMNLRASALISKLMSMGMMVTINQQIDAETATILADEYGCKVNIVSLYDETIITSESDDEGDQTQRPPIVTVMGHVDHGKTKLLDAIRSADVISKEHGGITQHIGAYMVHTRKGNITFLDTPGHSAFSMMRARGAQITDLVVLVVAANSGVMPQTVEAIKHAKEAKSPIIVAINKMDLSEANPDMVKQQLSEYDLIPEDWGGSTQFVEISALKNEGIDNLLDVAILVSEMLELKANWIRKAEGKVIESKIDQGRGIVSTVLVENGTLRVGDAFLAGIYHGKVRAMFNDKGLPLKEATPSMPVEILGFSGIPDAGDPFQVTENEKEARQYGGKRQELRKMETAKNVKKITLDNLYDSIQDSDVQELRIIIKGDVHGSVEALQDTLEDLSTDEIRLVCIRAAAGAIIEDDVNLAAALDAVIIGFHVRPTTKALTIAEREKVEIRKYNVIYDAVEDIKNVMEGMLKPDMEERLVGRIEIREIFKVPRIGTIAGCMVMSGSVNRKSQVHLVREGVVLHTGGLVSLRRFKEDAKEVKEGYECGIGLEGYSDIQVGDIIEVFEIAEVAKKLGVQASDE
ncbi:Translation initiation factor 2 [Olavius algarvensis spirochete endosymbiont]|uniref:translation initiation factor IF-2 n=1 Tax=Olavius algarvensis spirochete endosymbiont TaxID=260710 RepID=UPI00052CF170|nr:translation initiation factor IF-2 [Olavius algarvensis spirochete endosymbiont]KGM44392.1 translation initiation factor IF-2 [Alkalispirochaeta odontotermitis]VDA99820.1 Translation initiation factor 2 [Olavius algarvensis spirochete endosymbiont]